MKGLGWGEVKGQVLQGRGWGWGLAGGCLDKLEYIRAEEGVRVNLRWAQGKGQR